jgi:hypothetical protein
MKSERQAPYAVCEFDRKNYEGKVDRKFNAYILTLRMRSVILTTVSVI